EGKEHKKHKRHKKEGSNSSCAFCASCVPSLPYRIYEKLSLERLVGAAAVNTRNLASHRPEIRRELAAMMRRVQIQEIQICDGRQFHQAEECNWDCQFFRRQPLQL